jgi:3-deoxy-D-manno-octulosonic-acid transferase
MAASLGLALYNLRPRRDAGVVAPRAPRPAGRLVWLHAPVDDAIPPMLALSRRLMTEDGIGVVLTGARDLARRPGEVTDNVPPDTIPDARAFLDHWRPEAAVLFDGELRPALLSEAYERRIPVIMAEGSAPYLLRDREGWYPGLVRSTLSRLHAVAAVDEDAARAFRKAGAAPSVVAVTGRMEHDASPPAVNVAEHAGYARILTTRPVWAALGVPRGEEAAVIAAHRTALRYSHRLLMILVADDLAQLHTLAESCAAEGWTVAARATDDEPDSECQVWLAAGNDDDGLWLRLAPVCYLGGSLSGQGPSRDPLAAAALGSAILTGPTGGRHAARLARLTAARAARTVARPTELGDTLTDLLSPDRAARLAQAAWVAITDGHDATGQVLAHVRDILDGRA